MYLILPGIVISYSAKQMRLVNKIWQQLARLFVGYIQSLLNIGKLLK